MNKGSSARELLLTTGISSISWEEYIEVKIRGTETGARVSLTCQTKVPMNRWGDPIRPMSKIEGKLREKFEVLGTDPGSPMRMKE